MYVTWGNSLKDVTKIHMLSDASQTAWQGLESDVGNLKGYPLR